MRPPSADNASMVARLTLGLVLLAATASAMGIRESQTLLAKSADGVHALYELRGAGRRGAVIWVSPPGAEAGRAGRLPGVVDVQPRRRQPAPDHLGRRCATGSTP